MASGAELLEPAAPWLDRSFNSPVTRSLLAPWALHNGLGPDDAASALFTKVIGGGRRNGWHAGSCGVVGKQWSTRWSA